MLLLRRPGILGRDEELGWGEHPEGISRIGIGVGTDGVGDIYQERGNFSRILKQMWRGGAMTVIRGGLRPVIIESGCRPLLRREIPMQNGPVLIQPKERNQPQLIEQEGGIITVLGKSMDGVRDFKTKGRPTTLQQETMKGNGGPVDIHRRLIGNEEKG